MLKLPLRSRYGIQPPPKFPCATPLWSDPHPTLNQDNHKSVFCSYSFAFSKMSYKLNNMCFLSLTPFAKQNAFEIHPCSCVCQEFTPLQKKKKDFFLLLNNVLFMDIKVYPFPSQWTSGLFLIFGYYKWSYCKHLCLGFWMNISFNFTLVNTREWDCCICGDSMFNFKKTPKNCQIVF